MEQTTSLKSNVHESSLKWNIENFLDYAEGQIDTLSSKTVKIEGTQARWALFVRPPNRHSNSICISMKIEDENPSDNHLFKVEIRADASGHELMSPSNRHHVHNEGMFAEPRDTHPDVVNVDYRRINSGDKYFLDEVQFMHNQDLMPYLSAGTFTIFVHVWMKENEIVETFSSNRQSGFY